MGTGHYASSGCGVNCELRAVPRRARAEPRWTPRCPKQPTPKHSLNLAGNGPKVKAGQSRAWFWRGPESRRQSLALVCSAIGRKLNPRVKLGNKHGMRLRMKHRMKPGSSRDFRLYLKLDLNLGFKRNSKPGFRAGSRRVSKLESRRGIRQEFMRTSMRESKHKNSRGIITRIIRGTSRRTLRGKTSP
jgi:hypothetical protein